MCRWFPAVTWNRFLVNLCTSGSWQTIRLLLLLTNILQSHSCQVDYTQVFPQAPLEDPIYMRMPQGWHADSNGNIRPHSDPTYNDKSHYIKLKKILYGCRQAARNWYEYLKKGLLAHGFHQSNTESCIYMRDDCIMVVYTDDCLLFARDDKTIDSILTSLSQTYMLEDQGTVTEYLGIRITKNTSTKQIHMAQPGLIESILTDLGLLHDSNTKDMPALGVLHPNQQGHP